MWLGWGATGSAGLVGERVDIDHPKLGLTTNLATMPWVHAQLILLSKAGCTGKMWLTLVACVFLSAPTAAGACTCYLQVRRGAKGLYSWILALEHCTVIVCMRYQLQS
jgi:hypothetical protein